MVLSVLMLNSNFLMISIQDTALSCLQAIIAHVLQQYLLGSLLHIHHETSLWLAFQKVTGQGSSEIRLCSSICLTITDHL